MAGGDIFLTGATGFLGTAVLARLVRDTDRRVVVLVRARDDVVAAERVRSALAPVVGEDAVASGRVIALAGDLEQAGLGLGARRRDALAMSVTHVVHCAASVSFALPLERAREINVDGARRVLELASACRGLERLTHVSTAYVAGTHRGVFGEDDHDVGQSFNNTYERSKWEAERLVRAHAERLPVQVLRPSIVVGEERGGWTSSFNVIYTPLRAFARGALPAVPARRGAPVDVVPVSYVADAVVALTLTPGGAACRTYHLTASERAGTVGELMALGAARFDRRPPRAIPPRLYRRVLHPLLLRRATGAQRRWLERGEVFFPYFAPAVRFDATRARAAGLEPPLLADYFDDIVDYAERAAWGTRATVPDAEPAKPGAAGRACERPVTVEGAAADVARP